MKRCICIFNNSGEKQVTIIKDNSILSDFYGSYELDSFLLNTGVDRLDVIIKPTITTSVPDNGLLISVIESNKIKKSLVISEDDVATLNDFSATYGIAQVSVHSYLDVVVDRFKHYDKAIVIFDWTTGLTGLAYIEFGQLKDFKRVRSNNLSVDLRDFRRKYTADVVSFDKVYDFPSLKTNINNFDLIPKDMINQIAHIPYMLEAKGRLVSDMSSQAYNIASSIEDSVNEIREVLVPSVKPRIEAPSEPKVGFWKRLFGKSNSNMSFKTVEDTQHLKQTDDEIFSQLADGVIDEHQLRDSKGGNTYVTRSGSFQYVIIGLFMIVTFTAVVLTGLNAIYVSGDSLMAGEYDSLIKVKNKIETSVELNESPSNSPAMKIAQINSLQLPDGYSVKSINYSNDSYSLMIAVEEGTNVDSLVNYLPNGMNVTTVNELVGEQYSSGATKMYEILLLIA